MSEAVKLTERKLEAKSENSVAQIKRTDHYPATNLPMDEVLYLQRTIGNREVQRLFKSGVIQAKLKIGQPNDIYEQEADRIAEQVMRMPEPIIQHKTGCPECPEREKEEQVLTKPIADQMTSLVQRQVEPGEEEKEEEESLQTKEISSQTPEVTPEIESRIQSIRGGGQPLDPATRAYFEPRFGYDLGHVRVHTDLHAVEVARSVNAKAFTVGRDIMFGTGHYTPGTMTGKRLFAHELTHIIQQHQAPFSKFPSSAKVRKLPVNHTSLSIQLHPIDYSRIMIRGREVKRLIRERNAEVYAIIERNRLNGTFAEARRETIEGEERVWSIAVSYIWTGLATGGRAYELLPPRRTTSGSRTTVFHGIQIEINPIRMDSDELRSRIPDPQQRLEFMAAETLFHECVHALILIERTLSSGAAHSRIFIDFQSMLRIANSLALREQKSAVMTALITLVTLAHASFPSDASRLEYVNNRFEYLINEKHTRQTTSRAFGHAWNNSQIARTYADVVATNIERRGTSFSDRRIWDTYVEQLRRSLYLLYERIDGELLGPPPEIIPSPHFIPPSRPVPAPLIRTLP